MLTQATSFLPGVAETCSGDARHRQPAARGERVREDMHVESALRVRDVGQLERAGCVFERLGEERAGRERAQVGGVEV